jgi:hypothetical protein
VQVGELEIRRGENLEKVKRRPLIAEHA